MHLCDCLEDRSEGDAESGTNGNALFSRLRVTWSLCAPCFRALVASIRYLADFPCPHCLVLKSQIGDLGLPGDMNCRENVRKYP